MSERNRVFLIHGRNHAVVAEIGRFIADIGLQPMTFDEVARRFGSNPNIEAVVRQGLSESQATIAIVTPDERAQLRTSLRGGPDRVHDRTRWQCRANVFYETGLARALNKEATRIVTVGRVDLPSDFDGLLKWSLSDDKKWREGLWQHFVQAGCTPKPWSDEFLLPDYFRNIPHIGEPVLPKVMAALSGLAMVAACLMCYRFGLSRADDRRVAELAASEVHTVELETRWARSVLAAAASSDSSVEVARLADLGCNAVTPLVEALLESENKLTGGKVVAAAWTALSAIAAAAGDCGCAGLERLLAADEGGGRLCMSTHLEILGALEKAKCRRSGNQLCSYALSMNQSSVLKVGCLDATDRTVLLTRATRILKNYGKNCHE